MGPGGHTEAVLGGGDRQEPTVSSPSLVVDNV